MKGGEVSINQSKKTKPDKATFRELSIALWKIKTHLENVRVRDENCKLYPVVHLFMMIGEYIPQATNRIRPEYSGGHSLRGLGVGELLQTRISWEAMGIAKGKLPRTMMTDQHGNEMKCIHTRQ